MVQPSWNSLSPKRYPGGKSSLVPVLMRRAGYIRTFCDPMVGGGSLPLTIRRRWPWTSCVISDNDLAVYDFWLMLRDHGIDLHRQATKVWSGFDSYDDAIAFFAAVRPVLRSGRFDQMERAVAYFLCNRIGFSGVTGQSCGATGRSSPRINQRVIDTLPYWSSVIQGVEIRRGDYRAMVPEPGALTFFDPPYEDATDAERRLYSEVWQRHELTEFADHLIDLDRRGRRWLSTLMMSSSTEQFILDKLQSGCRALHFGKLPVQHSIVHRAADELILWNY